MIDDIEKLAPGRRETRKAERRAAIVEVATRHFLEHGYDRTSMSAIVEEMGGSKGTLWSHFASKQELFTAVIDEATASFRLVMATVLDPSRDIIETLQSFAEKFMTRITKADAIALQRLITAEVERFPEIGHIFYERAPGVSKALLTEYVAGRMQAGMLSQDDPREAARMLLDLCCGHYRDQILWGIETQDERTIKAEATLAVRQFLRCYAGAGLRTLPDSHTAKYDAPA